MVPWGKGTKSSLVGFRGVLVLFDISVFGQADVAVESSMGASDGLGDFIFGN